MAVLMDGDRPLHHEPEVSGFFLYCDHTSSIPFMVFFPEGVHPTYNEPWTTWYSERYVRPGRPIEVPTFADVKEAERWLTSVAATE
jgi:hypothetical protein